MKDNFRKAKRILGTNLASSLPDKGEYLKLCGQRFWAFVSGNDNLYTEIIEPLGHRAKEKNDQFLEEYSKVVNKFSFEFMEMFCDSTGAIHWEKVIQFNSGKNTTACGSAPGVSQSVSGRSWIMNVNYLGRSVQ